MYIGTKMCIKTIEKDIPHIMRWIDNVTINPTQLVTFS